MTTYTQDPTARLTYSVSWAAFLTAAGDTADSAVWVAPDGVTIEDSAITDGVHVGTISGGTIGSTYEITSRLTTVGGLVQDQSFAVSIAST